MRSRLLTVFVAVVVAALLVAPAAGAKGHAKAPTVRELASFAAAGCEGGCGSGSALGPDGALYVTDGKAGRVLRIDTTTGATSVFASGLPPAVAPIGGAMDVDFIGRHAYVLVTLVGPFFGQPDVVDGIYRVEADGSLSVVADIGQWSIDNPPVPDFFIPSGVQYSMQRYGHGFLVADGHHNRVLWVRLDGQIFELQTFANIVPTGLEVLGRRILLAQAGPIPHLPENGKVVAFGPGRSPVREVASGAPLVVDVERGSRTGLLALSQGIWDLPVIPENEGMPASADTGQLLRVEGNGSFTPLVEGLDRPTSLEIVGETAFVVTLTGKVLRIDHLSR